MTSTNQFLILILILILIPQFEDEDEDDRLGDLKLITVSLRCLLQAANSAPNQ